MTCKNNYQYYFAFLSISIILIIIYGNSFNCDWHFDDYSYIHDNENIHITDLGLESLTRSLSRGSLLQKRPISYLSFALNYYFGKLNPFGYHIVNISIHLLNSLLLFVLLFRTLNPSLHSQKI